jgi:superoxide dismutase, Cu-Zn family
MSQIRLLAVLIPLLLVAGCERSAPPETPPAPAPEPATAPPAATPPATVAPPATGSSARVMLQPTEGHSAAGELTLRSEAGGLLLNGHVHGLQPGADHGFHIHQHGDCSAPDGSSAGDHFALEGEIHGRVGTGSHHAGDMPNLRADADGHAMVELRLERLELGSGSPLDVANRALVVHQGPDDYVTQPAGNSGARVACGVITLNGAAADAPPAATADPAGDTE